MPDADRRAVLALRALVELLERVGEDRWIRWARHHLERARAHGIDPGLRSVYGGMGSFSDLYLSHVNGHALDDLQEPWANELLAVLRERLYQLAREAGDDRFEAGWTAPGDPPVRGWRCLACGHAEIGDGDIEVWTAAVLVPAHVGDANLEHDPTLVETILAGALLGADVCRGDLRGRAAASGIGIAGRRAWMRPCPSCGSGDTAVYRWVLAGGGLHPADDNLELRGPDFRHRDPCTPAELVAALERTGCSPVGDGVHELAGVRHGELLARQREVMEALRGLDESVWLAVYEDVAREAARDAWEAAGPHTWRIPDPMSTRVLLQTSLDTGVWQMYAAPEPVPTEALPDLFRGGTGEGVATLGRLGVVAMIEAWHDNTEWRVAVRD